MMMMTTFISSSINQGVSLNNLDRKVLLLTPRGSKAKGHRRRTLSSIRCQQLEGKCHPLNLENHYLGALFLSQLLTLRGVAFLNILDVKLCTSGRVNFLKEIVDFSSQLPFQLSFRNAHTLGCPFRRVRLRFSNSAINFVRTKRQPP